MFLSPIGLSSMKSKFLTIIFCYFVLVASVFAQANEAKQIDEFGYIPCGDFMARGQVAFQEQEKIPDSKIYVIYYEGRHYFSSAWNKETKSYDIKYINPRRGDALSRANEMKIFLNTFPGFSNDNLVIINGGYKEKFILEVWIVPKNAKEPIPTPTIEEKDIKFRKGKPFKSRDISKCYG